ncbi:MAG: hypothetical protein QM756_02845 [Polyangiaceae bacterium]
MADNDLVIVGHQRAVVLYKPPASIANDKIQLLTVIDVLAPHKDGFVLATCRHRQIPLLREAGAEVIVVDADANHYTMQAQEASEPAMVALLDCRLEEHQSEMALAEAGKDRNVPTDDDDASA